MNRHRAPRRSSTAPSQFGNPMNLPRARRFPVPRNDLPSNRDDLFELVIQTTTSALTQNLRIEELLPILCQSRDHRTRNTSAVIADVTQLLERDLLALVGLSEAITRTPTTPPVTPPTSKMLTTKEPLALVLPMQRSFAPARVLNASPPDTSISTVIGINVPCVTPLARDTSPDSVLFVSPKTRPSSTTDVAPDEHLLMESNPRPSPQIPEENPDLNILIDSRTLTSPVLVSTVERPQPDLIVTSSDELSTSSSQHVEEVFIEERPLLEYSDVYPIEIISPTPTRFAPVTPSPLREYLSYENSTPVSQSSVRSSPELESPPSPSLHSRSSNYSDVNSHSSSPVNDDVEDSARSF
ncbi:hypothetical protein BU15DRAFT_78089 [Melanogaster broomeanus]|nr:hypothetical protein BU15DRAFT_78089 [Melanogaster broomeanus]